MLDDFEKELRAAAPTLPPALRSRTLARCSAQTANRRRRTRQTQLRWVWLLTGVCALHWLIVSHLDAQNSALVAGGTTHSSGATTTYATVPDALSNRTVAFSSLLEKTPPVLNQQPG